MTFGCTAARRYAASISLEREAMLAVLPVPRRRAAPSVAALELGALAGLRLYGTCSAGDFTTVERLGAVAIDYRNEDFLARVRELTDGKGVDVVLDSLGGPISLHSFRALRPGGRLVVFGRYSTLSHGHKHWSAVIKWYASIGALWLWDKLSPRRRVSA